MQDRIDNAPLAAAAERAVERGYTSWTELANELGYVRKQRRGGAYPSGQSLGVHGDSTRLRRKLGLIANHSGVNSNGGKAYSVVKTIDYELAVQLTGLLHLDPVDVGV